MGFSSSNFKEGPPRCGSVVKLADDFCRRFYNFPFVIYINFLKRLLKLCKFKDSPHLKY